MLLRYTDAMSIAPHSGLELKDTLPLSGLRLPAQIPSAQVADYFTERLLEGYKRALPELQHRFGAKVHLLPPVGSDIGYALHPLVEKELVRPFDRDGLPGWSRDETDHYTRFLRTVEERQVTAPATIASAVYGIHARNQLQGVDAPVGLEEVIGHMRDSFRRSIAQFEQLETMEALQPSDVPLPTPNPLRAVPQKRGR